MSRLAPFDKALVLILVPLWVVCFAIGVRNQVRGGGTAGLGLSVEDADSYPTITGFYSPLIHPSDPLEPAGLRPGDRLIRLGREDLRGVGALGFNARITDEAGRELSVPLVFERDDRSREASLALEPLSVWAPGLAGSFAYAAAALFLLLRGRPTPMLRAFFRFGMCAAFVLCTFPASRLEFYAWLWIDAIAQSLYFPMALAFLFLFPDDRAPEGTWHRIWPWFFVLHGATVILAFSNYARIAVPAFVAIGALGSLTAVAVVTYKYRRAEPVARRQMKWVLFGIYCTVLVFVIAVTAPVLDPRLGWLHLASNWAQPLIPLSLVISVWRFNLFDIDRILSATASYNVLAVLLVSGVFVLVPRLSEATSGFLEIDPGSGQVALSLGLAAILIPIHGRLRPRIDRLFFKERYALDRGVADLLPVLSQCGDARVLTERVGRELSRLLRPETCVVYALVEEGYAAVFAEGRAVVPAFAADSLLIEALRERRAPLALSEAGRRPDQTPLSALDRAALETLGGEAVLPVRQNDLLAAFVCLGTKRSGDVYTSTDISLLAAVAETVSLQLERFDQDEVIRDGRRMQESLRRYVPGAIAEQLGSGGDLTSGEREVSVLFMDIRGYTGFAESREAEEIFSTINRYTETVSQIVQEHGGSVVEFNGDGMMAVFGAPRKLVRKERAAVEAGCAIVKAVEGLPVEGGETLSVGVGIATGKAFVGNIQAVDRMIWSAIGNTTNLAARLQGLTRELDAALVIDATTKSRAAAASADFEPRRQVRIRGRREAQDLYVLPM